MTVVKEIIDDSVKKVKKKWPLLASLNHKKRCELINDIAEKISLNFTSIIEANKKDLDVARNENLSKALVDRLTLSEARLNGMVNGLKKIANLDDPLDDIQTWHHVNGMKFSKVRVPIGVILVVYEARPNVTTDTVGLAIKTGNSAILKGSRQTKFSNSVLGELINAVLEKNNLKDSIAFFPELSPDESKELISNPDLDLVIPRGGEGLKKIVNQNSKAPVLGAGGGVCHAYISQYADLNKAREIIFNSKTQRPGVCNALETVLINEDLLQKDKIEELFRKLLDYGVSIRVSEELKGLNEKFNLATEKDWETEYLDLILSVKVVSSVGEAIEHINKYSTGHSDTIITENKEEARTFTQQVDSGSVYVNASTRFTDGEEYGFGAEIGISTQKLHARGPIGPKELTTYKYIIEGDGQTRT
ncbi:MAG: glutamate-5-semialdehyde dehydrogenase [Candidatus Caenarcaniphilales bacterium]|nr:glutamate-5-semialdehyde dehydrogenase [Candidatus Caenarcaniphilales bacterium]